jgi:hypothetical protein
MCLKCFSQRIFNKNNQITKNSGVLYTHFGCFWGSKLCHIYTFLSVFGYKCCHIYTFWGVLGQNAAIYTFLEFNFFRKNENKKNNIVLYKKKPALKLNCLKSYLQICFAVFFCYGSTCNFFVYMYVRCGHKR